MEKINFGIIGCGNIAKKFATALNKSNCANLVAIASRDFKKANQFSSLYECEGIVGYDNLLEKEDVDAVYIATPIGTHMEWCIASARKEKHILCEKTLALNELQVNEIVKACELSNVCLFEGFAYQFHPQHKLLERFICDGKIGKPLFLDAKFGFPPIDSKHRYDLNLGGGALLDAGTYAIHIARKIFKKEPIGVKSFLDSDNQEVDVTGSVLLDFGDGQIAQLTFGFNCYYRNYCSIWGTDGLLELQRAFSVPDTLETKLVHSKQDYREEYVLEPFNVFVGEIEYFCKNIKDNKLQKKWLSDSVSQIKVIDNVRQDSLSFIK
jgi:dTDP-3,4-didehydro-2,6-dideoxy-alpha-D-glucose 3-reductase